MFEAVVDLKLMKNVDLDFFKRLNDEMLRFLRSFY